MAGDNPSTHKYQTRRKDLAPERLREVLRYDPETGVFTWAATISDKIKVGAQAGTIHKSGYAVIGLDGGRFMAHRLAWLHAYGKWPIGDIDHLNGLKTDNRLENLRDVTRGVNMQNLRKSRRDSKSGLQGVGRTQQGKPRSQLMVAGKFINLGIFATPEDAHAAYIAAKRKYHPGCTI